MDESDNVVAFPGADTEALDVARLFDAHAAYLRRVVHRLTGSQEMAEDVVQEVFVLAYRRRQELEDRQGIRTWLYRAAVNHVRHRRRSFARYQSLLDRYKGHAYLGMKATPEPFELTQRSERGAMIRACVAELSAKQREVFVLYELEGLDGSEISDILGIPLNTVWSRLRLARAAFRKKWTDRVDMEAE